jgi:hypothetical protein
MSNIKCAVRERVKGIFVYFALLEVYSTVWYIAP